MTGRARMSPCNVVTHLAPDRWAQANRFVVGKALGEFSHERILVPGRDSDGLHTVNSDDGAVTYRFAADRLALDHWQIDVSTITRRRAGCELPIDALDLVLELRQTLGLDGERLGLYLEELSSTLSATAFKLAAAPMSAAELARSDFQTIEARMIEGHPCFVANSGRLGFDAADYLRYAPEAAAPVRLIWLAAHRDQSTFSTSEDLDYDRLIEQEFDSATIERFARTMIELARIVHQQAWCGCEGVAWAVRECQSAWLGLVEPRPRCLGGRLGGSTAVCGQGDRGAGRRRRGWSSRAGGRVRQPGRAAP